MTTIILVTHHALSSQDAEELVASGKDPATPPTFHVAVPADASAESMGAVLSDWEMDVTAGRGSGIANHPEEQDNPAELAEYRAERVLEASLATLREAGAAADGEVTPHHPLDSIGDMVAHHHPDEVVVMIRHHRLSELTSSDLAAKIRRRFGVETLRVKAH
jgi:hypothetical protein